MFLEAAPDVEIIPGYLPGWRQQAVRVTCKVGAVRPSMHHFRRWSAAIDAVLGPLPGAPSDGPRAGSVPRLFIQSLVDRHQQAMTKMHYAAVDAGRWRGSTEAGREVVIEFPCSALHTQACGALLRALIGCANAAAAGDAQPVRAERLRNLMAQQRDASRSGANRPHFIREAFVLGMPVTDLAWGAIQVGWGVNGCWFDSSFTERSSIVGAKLARSKPAAAVVMRLAGLPVPDHTVVATAEEALHAARTLGYPVVVKPVDRDGGEGVYAGLGDEAEVRRAFGHVRELGANVLVEKHVAGRDFRLVVFRGRMIAAIERIPGGVTGDGRSTVRELLDALNADPGRGSDAQAPLKRIDFDDELQQTLRIDGRTIGTVPAAGEFVRLRRAANFARGGTVVGAFDRTHPDNRDLAIRAAEALRLDLAGIDLLIPDIGRSWLETGAGICEVNAQPYLGQTKPRNLFAQILTSMVPGTGRIPVVAVVHDGNDDVGDAGDAVAGVLASAGVVAGVADSRCVRVGAQAVAGPMGFLRAGRMLVLDRRVQAAVVFTSDAKALVHGAPVDRIDLIVAASESKPARELVARLRAYGEPQVVAADRAALPSTISAFLHAQAATA